MYFVNYVEILHKCIYEYTRVFLVLIFQICVALVLIIHVQSFTADTRTQSLTFGANPRRYAV